MTQRNMIRESELGRATTRANLVEEALCKLKKTSIEIAKKGIACDIKRNQNEMKERLHRYRRRQKDIMKSKFISEHDGEDLDEFHFASQMLKRNNTRPKTCPAGGTRKTNSMNTPEPEIELDPLFYADQQKSKIDLRPRTAVNCKGDRDTLNKIAPKGRLGSQILQTRYFDEDELEQRDEIYKHFLRMRKGNELKRFDSSITPRVGEFCSNDTELTEAEVKRRLDRNTILRSKSDVIYKLLNKQPKFTSRGGGGGVDGSHRQNMQTQAFGKTNNKNIRNIPTSKDTIVRATTAPASCLRRTLGDRAKGKMTKTTSKNSFSLRAK